MAAPEGLRGIWLLGKGGRRGVCRGGGETSGRTAGFLWPRRCSCTHLRHPVWCVPTPTTETWRQRRPHDKFGRQLRSDDGACGRGKRPHRRCPAARHPPNTQTLPRICRSLPLTLPPHAFALRTSLPPLERRVGIQLGTSTPRPPRRHRTAATVRFMVSAADWLTGDFPGACRCPGTPLKQD